MRSWESYFDAEQEAAYARDPRVFRVDALLARTDDALNALTGDWQHDTPAARAEGAFRAASAFLGRRRARLDLVRAAVIARIDAEVAGEDGEAEAS
jgi:hypothetical protein